MPPSPKHGQAGNIPEKKKRRQNVACDSCRLRRVKCDMLALLTPADSTRVMPPLPVLVRQNPDVSCSNCISKGIRCTTNQIVNPSKPNKGGKRIEEAKKMYGSEGLFTPLTGGPSAPTTPSLTYTGPQLPPNRHDSVATTRTSASSASSSSYDLTDVPTTVDLSNTDFLFTNIQYPYPGTDLLNQGTSPSGSPCELRPAWSTEWSSNAVSTPYGTPFAGGVFDMTAQVPTETQMFDTFMFPPGANAPYPQAQALLYAAPPSLYVSSADAVPAVPTLPNLPPLSLGSTLDGASGANDPSAFPSLVSGGSLDTRSDHPFRNLSSGDNSPVPPPAQLPSSSVVLPAVTEVYPTPSLSTKSSTSTGPPQIVGKKRHHADDDVLDLVRTYGQIVRDYGDNAETGPWALWAKSKSKEDKIIRWSSSNNVGDELASRALGSELSRDLVKVYFSSAHLTLPAISPSTFYMLWKQAGERSDRMNPAQEVLCAVIEAWAARFSDHPVVLGMNPNEQHSGPKLILATESDHSGSLIVDQSHYGQKRLRVCFALVERARKLIDQHGILRKPSLTGVQALALFTQLQHMTDHNPEAPEHLMESEMLHTILVQQLRRLDGCWVPEGSIPIFKNDGPETQQEQRIKLRRLWWTVFIADSFWAAGTCSTPVVPEEEVKASLAWLDAIDPRHMPSTFDSMSFFMGNFHRVSTITRMVAYKLCLPSKRPGRVDVDQFCRDACVIWRNVRDLYEDINSKVGDLLSIAREDILGFSPVHQFCSLRLAATYILLIMQQVIQQLLDFRKRLHEAYVYDYTVPLQAQPEGTRVSALNELHAQSIDILLANARAQAPMFDTLLPTGFMQGASMLARVSLAAAQFLSEVPTNEQGYPNDTRGGVDWTWENKQAEVEKCVKALHQLGWAWADVSPVLSEIKMNMVRMTPTQETLLSYAFKAQNISEDAARQAARRDSDGRRDSQALDAVLEFWPPTSVPKMLDSMNARQYAIKQQDAYNYSRGNFEHQPSERNSSFPEQRSGDPTPSTGRNPTPAARPSTSTGTAVHPVDPIRDDFTFGSSGGIGSATAAGWTALGAPRSSATVPLASELVDLTDLTDAKLQADLESFIETLVKDMPDA